MKSGLALSTLAMGLIAGSATTTTSTTTKAVTYSGDAKKDYADGVWMGAYYAGEGEHQPIAYVDQDILKQSAVLDDIIDEAKVEALKTITDQVDIRYGGWRAHDPTFPEKCRLFTPSSDATCVYLFKLHGAENGRYLPIWVDQKVTKDQAQCIDLTNETTYSTYGRAKKDFFDDSVSAPDFLSLRIQGSAAVVLYETSDCSDERLGIEPKIDLTTGNITWAEDNLARFTWKFGHKTETGKAKGKKDKLFTRLDKPAYEAGEDACVCPNDDSQYPPTEDSAYLTLWTALEKHNYLRADVPDIQKVGIMKRLMTEDTSDEERYQLMEKYLGDAYHSPEASPYALTPEEVRAEIRRQVYHSIVVDGPSNLAHPFPDPCDLKFTPAARRFRSMRIITDFELEAYGKEQCGSTAASDVQALLATLQDQANSELADQLDYEQTLQNEMAAIEAAQKAADAEEEALILDAIEKANATGCEDASLCADIPSSYFPASCGETMRFIFKTFSSPPALPESYYDHRLQQFCKARCKTC